MSNNNLYFVIDMNYGTVYGPKDNAKSYDEALRKIRVNTENESVYAYKQLKSAENRANKISANGTDSLHPVKVVRFVRNLNNYQML